MKLGRWMTYSIFALLPSTGLAFGAFDGATIDAVSARYLGRPYVLGNLGEGTAGSYDRDPLFRRDVFDCQTYVETVMTEVLARTDEELPDTMNRIRYRDGRIGYFERNHFPESDWFPNNTRAGILEDITDSVVPDRRRSSRVYIDRRGWVDAHDLSAIQISGISADERRQRLDELKKEGADLSGEWVSIPYVASRDLLDVRVRRRIPSGTILSVVRENWNPAGAGTAMAVSHMGFAIWKEGILYYRNASSTERAVVDVRLTEYVKRYLDSPTVRGFNIHKIRQARE